MVTTLTALLCLTDPGSVNNNFPSDFTVSRETEGIPNVKRSLLTADRRLLDRVFDHEEEDLHVYCNHEAHDTRCSSVLGEDAVGTIVKLPAHVESGPLARVAAIERVAEFELPEHHKCDPVAKRNTNAVYRMKIDYAFRLAKNADDFNMRVDYTNLLTYWDAVTDTPTRLKERSVLDHGLSAKEWRSVVRKAKHNHRQIKHLKRSFLIKKAFRCPLPIYLSTLT